MRIYHGIVVWILIQIAMPFFVYGGSNTDTILRHAEDTVFRPNNYCFEAALTFYTASQVLPFKGEDGLQTKPAVSFQIGFMYSRFLRCGLGFGLGIRYGLLPFTIYFHVPQSRLSPQFQSAGDQLDYESFYNGYAQFPAEISYRVKFSHNYSLTLSTGVAIDVLLSEPGSETYFVTQNDNPYPRENVFQFSGEVNPAHHVLVGIPFEIMAGKIYKNKHAVNFGICYSLMFRPAETGEYFFFPDRNDESFGKLSVYNSYIGLKVSYTFRGKQLTDPPTRTFE